jgi:hypothetical protein
VLRRLSLIRRSGRSGIDTAVDPGPPLPIKACCGCCGALLRILDAVVAIPFAAASLLVLREVLVPHMDRV